MKNRTIQVGPGVSDSEVPASAPSEITRRKTARERERSRSRERYRAKRADLENRGVVPARGRPTVSAVEPLRSVVIGASVHAELAKMAANMSYRDGCDRKVTIRELIERAILSAYPEMCDSSNPDLASPAEVFSEILARALAGPADQDANWNGAGDRLAYECPSLIAGQPPAQFKIRELAWHLYRKMESGADTSEIVDVKSLVKSMVGWAN